MDLMGDGYPLMSSLYIDYSIVDYSDYRPELLNNFCDVLIEYDFVFSSDFSTITKDRLIENFKSIYYNNCTTYENYQKFIYGDNDIGDINGDEDDEIYNDEENYRRQVNEDNQIIINIFDNEDDLKKRYDDAYFNKDNYNIYGIIFKSLEEYTLQFSLNRIDGEIIDYVKMYNDKMFDPSIFRVHLVLNKAIIKTLVDSSNYKEFNVYRKIMDLKAEYILYKVPSFRVYMNYFILFLYFPCIYCLLNNLVTEKESKIKESLIIIGLKKSIFWISWAITYGIIVLVDATIMTIAIYGMNFFSYIRWDVVIILLTIYGISCCEISFISSTFINKSKTGNIANIIIIISFFFLILIGIITEHKTSIKVFLSFLLSPISLFSIFSFLIEFEKNDIPVDMSMMFKYKEIKLEFFGLIFCTILYLIIAIYLDNVVPQGNNFHRKWNFIYTDLMNYFKNKKDPIAASENTSKNKNKFMYTKNPYIQEDPQGMKKAVEVKNIAKNFVVKGQTLEVLRNIDFNGYYDEIFAILEHNGAGKTTLINIMIGILSATSGEVYYDGIPMTGNETEICKQIGYCPQFDTFNNNLKVGDHVKLFAGIKNVKVDVDEILKDIDLLGKKNNYPKELSGGQKRKLCITLALLGSPKFVFLDEPTTGLDPYSRKSIWKLLSRKKKDRIIFITTHYMDEADLLADRKMITSNGIINCLGSSFFLKNSFNMNYSLDIHMEESKDTELTDKIIEQYCPGASQDKIISTSKVQVHNDKKSNKVLDASNDKNNNNDNDNNNNNDNDNNNNNNDSHIKEDSIVTYFITMKCSNLFKNIFKNLNELIHDENNTIKNFSLTAPTLEELFIKLKSNNCSNTELQNIKNTVVIDIENGNNKNNDNINDNNLNTNISNDQNENNNNNSNENENDDNSRLVKKLEPIFGKIQLNESSSWTQIYSIMNVRLKMFMRNKIYAILYTVIPVIITVCCIIVNKYLTNQSVGWREFDLLMISPMYYYNTIKWFKEISKKTPKETVNIINGIESIINGSLDSIDNNYEGYYDLMCTYDGGFGGKKNSNTNQLQYIIYHKNINTYMMPISINLLTNSILKNKYNINKDITVYYKPLLIYSRVGGEQYIPEDVDKLFDYSTEELRLLYEPIIILILSITLSFAISIYGSMFVKEREDGITYNLYLNGTKNLNYYIGILLSDSICLSIPIIIILIIGCFSNISVFHIRVIGFTIFSSIFWVIASLLHQYAFSFLYDSYENILNKSIMINPVLALIVGIIIFYHWKDITNEKYLSEHDNKLERLVGEGYSNLFFVIPAICIYSPSIIAYALIGLSFYICIERNKFTLEDIQQFLSSHTAKNILSKSGITEMERKDELKNAFFNYKVPTLLDILNTDPPYFFIGIIIGMILLILFLVFVLYVREKFFMKIIRREIDYMEGEREALNKKMEERPTDVYQEWKRVGQAVDEKNNESHKSNIALKVYQLIRDYPFDRRKYMKEKEKEERKNNPENNEYHDNKDNKKSHKNKKYDNKTAFEKMDDRIIFDETLLIHVNRIVGDVSFGVNVGECLGLLGPNGAGKTTSISMISGTLNHTHGTIIYGNKNFSKTNSQDFSLGYCPQINSLWTLLTVKETIQFYLNICGYPPNDIPYYTQSLIEAFGIENHSNKLIKNISGGTKRKLSLIVAICSSPSYLILDEPSAGMDPFTRRYMWKIILNLKKVRKTATLLTTHSTEEAEALCDRIAIMIKGRLVCVDTSRSIKMNYNTYYTLEVFTSEPNKFEEEYVKQKNIFGIESKSNQESSSSSTPPSETSEPNKNYEVENSINYQKYSVKMKTEGIAKVFSLMEEAKENGLVSQYNFGQYSLEQVFISFINNI